MCSLTAASQYILKEYSSIHIMMSNMQLSAVIVIVSLVGDSSVVNRNTLSSISLSVTVAEHQAKDLGSYYYISL